MGAPRALHLTQERWERHLSNIEVNAGGCWVWTGLLNHGGYGVVTMRALRRTPMLVHRVSYLVLVGPIPDGKELDHLCRDRACCNPDHLEPVTRTINARRGICGAVNAARMLARTHCKHGHEFTPDNTRIDPNGWRVCRSCERAKRERKRVA